MKFAAGLQCHSRFRVLVIGILMSHYDSPEALAARHSRALRCVGFQAVVGERVPMITGVHCIIYNRQSDKLRSFFCDVLNFPYVDAGHDWLIFALPPAELRIHPTREEGAHELYLMCNNLETTLAELQAKGVE